MIQIDIRQKDLNRKTFISALHARQKEGTRAEIFDLVKFDKNDSVFSDLKKSCGIWRQRGLLKLLKNIANNSTKPKYCKLFKTKRLPKHPQAAFDIYTSKL